MRQYRIHGVPVNWAVMLPRLALAVLLTGGSATLALGLPAQAVSIVAAITPCQLAWTSTSATRREQLHGWLSVRTGSPIPFSLNKVVAFKIMVGHVKGDKSARMGF